jgi:hypothetical protein
MIGPALRIGNGAMAMRCIFLSLIRPLALSHAIYRQRQSLQAAIGFDEAGPMAGLGLGWMSVAASGIHPMLLAKSGGGVGFMSYIAFVPGRNAGLFVAVNRVDFAMFSGLTQAANALIANLITRRVPAASPARRGELRFCKNGA